MALLARSRTRRGPFRGKRDQTLPYHICLCLTFASSLVQRPPAAFTSACGGSSQESLAPSPALAAEGHSEPRGCGEGGRATCPVNQWASQWPRRACRGYEKGPSSPAPPPRDLFAGLAVGQAGWGGTPRQTPVDLTSLSVFPGVLGGAVRALQLFPKQEL